MIEGHRMRRKKWAFMMLGAVVLLAVVDVVTYYVFGKRARPLTVARYLPQWMHLGKPYLSFVCVGDETWDVLSEQDRDTLDRVLHEHFATVYHTEKEIPESSVVYMDFRGNGKKERVGLISGCVINWRVTSVGPLWFRANHSDWESNTGASGRKVEFFWLFSVWVPVWTWYESIS